MKLKVEKDEAEAYIRILAHSQQIVRDLELLESKRKIKQKPKFIANNFLLAMEGIQKEFWASDNMLDEYDKLMQYVEENWKPIMDGLTWEEATPINSK
jgi:hypothetical protein